MGTAANSTAANTAIVTGASRGLGLALARALAQRGWRLAIDARAAEPLAAAREELAGITDVVAVTGDVADERHRRELVAAAGDRIDLVVNNASLLGPSPLPPLADLAPAELEEILRANVVGPLGLIRHALPHMGEGGRILNITSDAAVEPYEGWGGYGASKAALEQLTRILAAERTDLRVYSVDPGDMRTRMQQDAFPGEDISDRPPPEASVPGLLALIEGELPSGRYAARELAANAGRAAAGAPS
jgi:NAD(P)-dependent dehydrogenase (short-subunit alcohol dehydrogenase family)